MEKRLTARPIDAAEGYRLYRRYLGAIELDEINEHLRGRELREVSPRMYLHYQRLEQSGYEAYLSINRLDDAMAGDYAWTEASRARYTEISKTSPAQIIWAAAVHDATVLSLGPATVTITTSPTPPVRSPVIVVLLTTGIERTGTVVRSDSSSELVHIAFDLYESEPITSAPAPYRATLRIELPRRAHTTAAVSDLMLNVDRFMVGLTAGHNRAELIRVHSLRMRSPLEIVLEGGSALLLVVALLKLAVDVRLRYFEGTVAKYEAEGIRLDNEQRRRAAQLAADEQLRSDAIEELGKKVGTPILDSLATEGLSKGEPNSFHRRRLIDSIQVALGLPVQLVAEIERTRSSADEFDLDMDR